MFSQKILEKRFAAPGRHVEKEDDFGGKPTKEKMMGGGGGGRELEGNNRGRHDRFAVKG